MAGPTLRTTALVMAVAWLVGPVPAVAAATEIVFASGADDSGTVRQIIDAFNEAHRGEIAVTWRQMDKNNAAHREQLLRELESGETGIDLIAADVVWTAELVKKGRVQDLTGRFNDAYDRKTLLGPALDSATYRLRIWGVPWYADAGFLFYRKDELAEAGFAAPPKTWAELSEMALKTKAKTGIRHGFVFQGAEYEGGTVNAAEFVWSTGGDLMAGQVTITGLVMPRVAETDRIRIRSREAAEGLDLARKLITDGVAPAEVSSFTEKEALDAFRAGDAVFLRSWPYAREILRSAGFTPEQIGMAPLPSVADRRSASCLGGWNLMIHSKSSPAEQQAAWTLIRYLTDSKQQVIRARDAGLLPVLVELYEDRELVNSVPVMALGKEILEINLRSRPKSPFYLEASSEIARVFNRVLKGELTGDAAVKTLDQRLRAIAIRNR